MKILFALPGLHRFDRGAEIAFIAVANELTELGDTVTLIGSGNHRPGAAYRFQRAASISREKFERFPFFPGLRNECSYEELSFVPGLLSKYDPSLYDVTITCSYPFTNWVLRRRGSGSRPPHIFVTQNGDWPAQASTAEYRFFGCDGLICTNPEFYERNKARWNCALIPNGVYPDRYQVGEPMRQQLGLAEDRLVVLMVSALIESKRVSAGIEAVSRIPHAHLIVAGDGPLRDVIDGQAARLLPDRFTRLVVSPDKMPSLYRSANVFLHMSKFESFGNVFLEAMASGLPITGHDSTNLRWIVGKDQFLTDTEDLSAVASSIVAASKGGGKRNRQILEFSWPKIAASYRRFLSSVVSNRSPTRRNESDSCA